QVDGLRCRRTHHQLSLCRFGYDQFVYDRLICDMGRYLAAAAPCLGSSALARLPLTVTPAQAGMTIWQGRAQARGPIRHFTRLSYSPVRVSTLMTSSWLTNSGTRTTAPVSRVAGLPPPPEVSPRTPGSVPTISSVTVFGGVTPIATPLNIS